MAEVPDTVDDALDVLSSPTTEEVELGTRDFSARDLASAAARLALAGGGGGSFPPAGWTVEDDLVQIQFPALFASLTLPLDEGNGGSILFTAVTPGADGNLINITKLDPGFSDVSLSVDVAGGTEITITLGTDGGGALTSTGTEILAALAANDDVTAIVTFEGSGNVGEIATPHVFRQLLGGADAYSAIFLDRNDLIVKADGFQYRSRQTEIVRLIVTDDTFGLFGSESSQVTLDPGSATVEDIVNALIAFGFVVAP